MPYLCMPAALARSLRLALMIGCVVSIDAEAAVGQRTGRAGAARQAPAGQAPTAARQPEQAPESAPRSAPRPAPRSARAKPAALPTGAKELEGTWEGLICQGVEYAALRLTLQLDPVETAPEEEDWVLEELGRRGARAHGASAPPTRAGRDPRTGGPLGSVVLSGEAAFGPLPGAHAPMGIRSRVVAGSYEVRVEFHPGSGAFRLTPGEWIEQPRSWSRGMFAAGILDAGEPALFGWVNHDPRGGADSGTPLLLWRSGAGASELARFAELTKPENPFLTPPDPQRMMEIQQELVAKLQPLRAKLNALAPTDVEGRRQVQAEMEALNQEFREALTQAQTGGAAPTATFEAMTAWLQDAASQHVELQANGKLQLSTLYLSQGLFSDELFAPVFGKPIDEFDGAERFALVRRIQDGRQQVADRNLNLAFSVVIDALGPNHPLVVLREGTQRRRRAYREGLLRALPRRAATPDAFADLAAIEEAVTTHLASLWGEERAAVLEVLEETRQRLGDDVFIARAQREVEAREADDRTTALRLSTWSQRQTDLSGYVSAAAGTRARAIVEQRLDELLAQDLAEHVQRLPALGAGLPAVRAGAAWYRDLLASFGFARNRPGVQAAVERLAARRAGDLASAAPEIEATLATLDTVAVVDSHLAELLCVPGDRESAAGANLLARAHARRLEIDRALFLARFSPREQEWMNENGELSPPATISEPPTGEEIRLAFLREVEWLGGQMLDAHSADVAMPGFRALGLSNKLHIKNVTVQRTKADGPKSFYCEYDIDLSMAVGDQIRQALEGSIQGSFAQGMMDTVNQNGPYRVVNLFQLTKSGWRSPTIREHGLESIADFYETARESVAGALEIFGF